MKTNISDLIERLPPDDATDDDLEMYVMACVKASCIGMTDIELVQLGYDPDLMVLTSREIGSLFGLSGGFVRETVHDLKGKLEWMLASVAKAHMGVAA